MWIVAVDCLMHLHVMSLIVWLISCQFNDISLETNVTIPKSVIVGFLDRLFIVWIENYLKPNLLDFFGMNSHKKFLQMYYCDIMTQISHNQKIFLDSL